MNIALLTVIPKISDDLRTSLGEERGASFCRNSCDVGGTGSNLHQPNDNLLLLGSPRDQPETCLGLFVSG